MTTQSTNVLFGLACGGGWMRKAFCGAYRFRPEGCKAENACANVSLLRLLCVAALDWMDRCMYGPTSAYVVIFLFLGNVPKKS